MDANTSSKQANRHKHLTLMILLMVPFTGMGVDLYAPSLPWIVHALHTTPYEVKLTIGMYLFGYAVGPIPAGTFSDIYGRRPTLLIGMVSYILICIVIITIPSIHVMQAMRFFQGFATGFLGVTFRAMITDSYDRGPDLINMGSKVAMAWSIGPIIAPFIGGYLQHYFNWKANFIFFIAYAIMLLIVGLIMPETNTQKGRWQPKQLLKQYGAILSHRTFLGSVICMGGVYSMIIFFNIVGPFLVQTDLGYNAIQFGYIALAMGFAFFTGNILNRMFIKSFATKKLMQAGFYFALVGFAVLLVIGLSMPLNLYGFIAPIFFSLLFTSLIFPNAMSTALGLFPQTAGAAGALMGLLFCGITGIASIGASYLKSSTQVPVATAYVSITVVCLIFFYGLMYPHLCNK